MHGSGLLVKMPAQLTDAQPFNVAYTVRQESPRPGVGIAPESVSELDISQALGRQIRLQHRGDYACIRCGRGVDKLFGEGLCYPCFKNAPEAAECIVRPELCEGHLGRGRDPEWELAHHVQPHAVYLAVSSAVKVGVTRSTQVPTRWIDQGAAWAVQIAAVPYRQLAGRIEVALKDLYTDRTAWQRMLKAEPAPDVDLSSELSRIREHVQSLPDGDELSPYLVGASDAVITHLNYPVQEVPLKVKSVNLQKNPVIESTLRGIRGQYLMFDGGVVMNVRRHSGFWVDLDIL